MRRLPGGEEKGCEYQSPHLRCFNLRGVLTGNKAWGCQEQGEGTSSSLAGFFRGLLFWVFCWEEDEEGFQKSPLLGDSPAALLISLPYSSFMLPRGFCVLCPGWSREVREGVPMKVHACGVSLLCLGSPPLRSSSISAG